MLEHRAEIMERFCRSRAESMIFVGLFFFSYVEKARKGAKRYFQAKEKNQGLTFCDMASTITFSY
ncbi:hypothetical protein [Clostridium sp. MSTE9]|uniref:hypothetical protein n=1 Tax=Clostridium sp. (strain MSTE9) TaxID=1105031 RepID=UPI0002E78095|nr:hypothetical protein [Clostridium sp. MSTE9]